MKKRMTCAALALTLCLGLCPAFAAEEKFPAVNTYPGYADVAEGDWFYNNAKLCYEVGLMTGTDKGFEPNKTLTVGECAALAARMGEKLTGETIPEVDPAHYVVSPPPWWAKYKEHLLSLDPHLTGLLAQPDEAITRYGFLSLLNLVCAPEEGLLEPINHIEALPDPDFRNDVVALQFYNAGILTGTDKYGTFAGPRSLTRAEAAAMVSRIVRPGLRLSFTPADYSPFTAAYLTPDTVMFSNGVTAEEFLITVNNAIAAWEAALGDEFNWHYVWTDGKTVLTHVKEDTLTALGVSERDGVQSYKDFDVQVYYSRLIDLIGGPL